MPNIYWTMGQICALGTMREYIAAVRRGTFDLFEKESPEGAALRNDCREIERDLFKLQQRLAVALGKELLGAE